MVLVSALAYLQDRKEDLTTSVFILSSSPPRLSLIRWTTNTRKYNDSRKQKQRVLSSSSFTLSLDSKGALWKGPLAPLNLLQLYGLLLGRHQTANGSSFARSQIFRFVFLSVVQFSKVLLRGLVSNDQRTGDGLANTANFAELLSTAAARYLPYAKCVQFLTEGIDLCLHLL